MQFNEFHNGLRILLNIDMDEFMDAVCPDSNDTDQAYERAFGYWQNFRENPHQWFIRAPTAQAEKLWTYMQERMGA